MIKPRQRVAFPYRTPVTRAAQRIVELARAGMWEVDARHVWTYLAARERARVGCVVTQEIAPRRLQPIGSKMRPKRKRVQ